jgi:hypothetical protein
LRPILKIFFSFLSFSPINSLPVTGYVLTLLSIILTGNLIVNTDVACNFRDNTTTTNSSSALNISESSPCWSWSQNVSRLDAYRIFLATFVCSVGQFVFCNVTKTKYLQILTTLMR